MAPLCKYARWAPVHVLGSQLLEEGVRRWTESELEDLGKEDARAVPLRATGSGRSAE